MQVIPHLSVSDAAGFIEFCKSAFGAKETMPRMTMPGGKVGHAEIMIGTSKMMIADEFPDMGCKSAQAIGGTPVVLNIDVADADGAAQRAAAAGATITMPVADQFWGARYGQFRDPFGNVWAVNQQTEQLTPEEMAKRAAQAMGA